MANQTSITDVSRNFPNSSCLVDLPSATRELIDGIRKSIGVCMPAAVLSYDRETHTAEVIPLVKYYYISSSISYVTRQSIKVTVRQFCHGGFMIDAPLFIGDTGWLISSDRDGSLCKQQDSENVKPLVKDEDKSDVETSYPQNPNTFVDHAFEHGFFVPDCWAKLDSSLATVADGSLEDTDLYIGTTLSDEAEKEKAVSIVLSPEGKATITAGEKGEIRLYCNGDEISIKGGEIKLRAGNSVTIETNVMSVDASVVSLPENTTIGGQTMPQIVQQNCPSK